MGPFFMPVIFFTSRIMSALSLEPTVHHFEREGQSLWVEESGHPEGFPVIVLHGGPGAGSRPKQRDFFDPHKYRVLLHDQRGCGYSGADAPLLGNTTDAILEDLRWIQEQLGIDRWLLFGGSWGATLALLFAQRWPVHTAGMVLRGAFLARQKDLDWFLGPEGANRLFPEAYEVFNRDIGSFRRHEPILAVLHRGLMSGDRRLQRILALAFEQWGAVLALGQPMRQRVAWDDDAISRVIRQAQIEIHYAVNRYFVEEDQILARMEAIREIPQVLVHGRMDWVCPVEASLELHRRMHRSTLRILESSHHVPVDEPMIRALTDATESIYQELIS